MSMTTISQVRFQWHRQRVTILPSTHVLYNPYLVHLFLQLQAWVSSVQNFYIQVAESFAFLFLYISWDETAGHCYLLVYMYSKLLCSLTCSNFRLGLCRKKASLSIYQVFSCFLAFLKIFRHLFKISIIYCHPDPS